MTPETRQRIADRVMEAKDLLDGIREDAALLPEGADNIRLQLAAEYAEKSQHWLQQVAGEATYPPMIIRDTPKNVETPANHYK